MSRCPVYLPEPAQRQSVQVAPGAVWLRNWLPLDMQVQLVDHCRALLGGPGGGYTPTVRGGGKMHVQMMCLGRHWNPLTYTYEATRADHDDLPVGPVPDDWVNSRQPLRARRVSTCRPISV